MCISHVNQSIMKEECYREPMFGRLDFKVNMGLVSPSHRTDKLQRAIRMYMFETSSDLNASAFE